MGQCELNRPQLLRLLYNHVSYRPLWLRSPFGLLRFFFFWLPPSVCCFVLVLMDGRFRWGGQAYGVGSHGFHVDDIRTVSRPSSLLLGVVFIIVYDTREILRVNFWYLTYNRVARIELSR